MSIFETTMLICFGVSWPVSIAKAIRTKKVAGKSPLFMLIVSLGYVSGLAHKMVYALDWVTVFYGINLVLVLTDLLIYYRYSRLAGKEALEGVPAAEPDKQGTPDGASPAG